MADCKYRGSKENGFLDEKDILGSGHSIPSTPPVSHNDATSMLVIEDAPLRYDVDIVTKLIVYAGK